MENLRFKTSLKCDGCIKTIEPIMNGIDGVEEWNVDLSIPDKILEVEAGENLHEEIIKKVSGAGFQIEKI